MLMAVNTNLERRHCNATALARYVHRRREQLRLKPARAAELAGLELAEWESIERGTIPQEHTLGAMAVALRINPSQLEILAMVAAWNQRPV